MNNKNDDRLDLILNAGIRHYSNPQPRAGMEQRIFQHVQTTPPARSAWSVAWALGMAAIVVAVLIAVPALRVSPPVPGPLPAVPQAAANPPVSASSGSRQTSRYRSSHRGKDPYPLPLTAEERALLRFVRERPEQAAAVLSQPAEIEAIKIKPLEIEVLQ